MLLIFFQNTRQEPSGRYRNKFPYKFNKRNQLPYYVLFYTLLLFDAIFLNLLCMYIELTIPSAPPTPMYTQSRGLAIAASLYTVNWAKAIQKEVPAAMTYLSCWTFFCWNPNKKTLKKVINPSIILVCT